MNVYDSIIEGAQELPAGERGQLYAAVLEYLYYEREPDFQMRPAPKAIYIAMKPVMANQLSASKRGKKGGRPSKRKAEVSENEKLNETSAFRDDAKTEKPIGEQVAPEATETEKPTESEQEQEQEYKEEPPKGGKKNPAPMKPPTPEEVDAYLAERGLSDWLTGTEFVGYYGSQGWRKANGQPVTNWKLAASGWASRERKRRGGDAHEHDFGAWEY